MNTKTFPAHKEVRVDLEGVDGNAFSIMGVCAKAMRRAKVSDADIKAIQKEATSGDYNHLLATYMEALDIEFGSDEDEEENWDEDDDDDY